MAKSGPSKNKNKNVRKRVMANERERERTRSLNQALEILRNRLPVPEAEKRSKIQTLRMAREYIEFLARFKKLQSNQEIEVNNLGSSNQTISHNLAHNTNDPFNNGPKSYPNDNDNNNDNNNQHVNNIQPFHQPDSPLTYKFYKFRLKKSS